MLGNLSGWHWVIILLIVLLLFGAPKLPALARSVGQSMKIFRAEIKKDDDTPGAASSSTSAEAPAEASDSTTKS